MLKLPAKGSPARTLIARANAARDEKRFGDAAILYREALRLEPAKGGIHVQAGHMFKEAGDLSAAEQHYREAARLMPGDADLALQFGHFYKISGRLGEAFASYQRAADLAPDWAEPKEEIARLRKSGWRDPADATGAEPTEIESGLEAAGRHGDLRLAGLYGRMAPENLPKTLAEMMRHSEESVNLRRLGIEQNTYWGQKPVLRGVEAIRGFCISTAPLRTVEARINGLPIHRGPLKGPFELEYEPDKSRIHKYVFNIWCDVSGFAPGLYELELSFPEAEKALRILRTEFVVEPPLLESDYPDSDGLINLVPGAAGSIEDQINARPSAVRAAQRTSMSPAVRNILVLRADQLGDLIASIPAITRLREIFPDARLVGMVGPANVDLARTLALFDEILLLDFRESLHQRTRTLTLEQQEELRARLAPFEFDLAIDLAQSRMSRPLLALTGARFTYGFKHPEWPRLSGSVDDATYDAKTGSDVTTHSTRMLTMIDRLAALTSSSARIIRRPDLTREALEVYGIAPGDRYAVLHMGARIVFSRWPHYLALASRLLRGTDLKIVLFTGDPKLRESFTPDLLESDRVIVLDRQLPFDEFDAFLSFCSVYVGNDSGPKHLASLRGAPVVSIHSARINWSEWGQEHTGVIVTRKVPCAGCLLYHDVDECGKDYVCVNGIPLDDVYDAVRRYV